MRLPFPIALCFLAVVAPAVAAQSGAVTPPGWQWRTDLPAAPQAGGTGNVTDSRFEFSPMAPGWHVTMGPGGILFDPQNRISGRFEVDAQFFLFPEPSNAEYGVFVGGAGLDGPGARWTTFVVRGDGSGAIFAHSGGRTNEVVSWTKHSAIAARDANGLARNVVSVRAEPDSVKLFVNGTRVAAVQRLDVSVDGQFGLRVGRGINIHVGNLDIKRRLAPFPPT